MRCILKAYSSCGYSNSSFVKVDDASTTEPAHGLERSLKGSIETIIDKGSIRGVLYISQQSVSVH
jgi:hypothetical protein